MAKQNKVAVNLQQDFTDEEKQLARNNIGAAASTDVESKSEIKVFEGSNTVHKDLMTIYEGSSTGALAGITFNNENSDVSMVKKPEEGDGGKVLTVVEPGGQIAPYYDWQTINAVPDGETYGQVLTWNGSTYVWANKTVWRPGFNMATRANSSDVSSPYMDCNWIPKWESRVINSVDSSTSSDLVSELTTADGQLTLEITHKARSSNEVQGAMYFRIKMNKTGASGLSVFGNYHECNRSVTIDSYSFCVGVESAGNYVTLEHPHNGRVYIPARSAGESAAFLIELKCSWTNSKHYISWANIQLTSTIKNINGFSAHDLMITQWGTLNSSSSEV